MQRLIFHDGYETIFIPAEVEKILKPNLKRVFDELVRSLTEDDLKAILESSRV